MSYKKIQLYIGMHYVCPTCMACMSLTPLGPMQTTYALTLKCTVRTTYIWTSEVSTATSGIVVLQRTCPLECTACSHALNTKHKLISPIMPVVSTLPVKPNYPRPMEVNSCQQAGGARRSISDHSGSKLH